MAKVSIPREDLFNPILEALRRLGGSGTIQEIHDQAVDILGLTDKQVEKLFSPGKSNQTEFAYRLSRSRSWLKRYGLVNNPRRGVWVLTPKGHGIESVDPKELERAVNEMLKQEKLVQADVETADSDDVEAFSPEADGSPREEEWRDTLYTVLKDMDPSAFERLCQRMLRESGFTQVEVTGRSGDEGIDGVGVMRLSGFISIRVLFQCKRYTGSVSAGVVRDFRGAMIGRTDKGLIVTTGNFTPAAKREATRDGAPEIDLVDGEQLIDKLKELSLGVKTEEVIAERVSVDPAFFDNI